MIVRDLRHVWIRARGRLGLGKCLVYIYYEFNKQYAAQHNEKIEIQTFFQVHKGYHAWEIGHPEHDSRGKA